MYRKTRIEIAQLRRKVDDRKGKEPPKKYGANAPQLRAISPIEENISLLDWMVHL